SGDGCNIVCETEPGYDCTVENVACSQCGDGVIGQGETCDDGNVVSGDGCDATCDNFEPGFTCTAPGVACEACGNGIKESTEACDDGGECDGGGTAPAGTACLSDATCGVGGQCLPVSVDGCDATCELEGAYVCPIAGQPCHLCGDGIIAATAACDDGRKCSNSANHCTTDGQCPGGTCLPAPEGGDGCSADCQAVTPGYDCSIPNSPCSLCGDTFVTGAEDCDDGNVVGGDGCSFNCQIKDPAYDCTIPGIACAICGDGAIGQSEVCDDGNAVNGDGCNDDCHLVEEGFSCPLAGVACEKCGNGIRESSEACDDGGRCAGGGGGANTGAFCTSDASCTVGGTCEPADGDGCSDFCTSIDPGFVCHVPGQVCVECGNGVIDANEICDDGNANSGDGCSEACNQVEPFYRCLAPNTACLRCGNGVVDVAAGEVCDDGNNTSEDGCRADCKVVDNGFVCPGGGGTCSLCANGVIDPGEQCDDSNITNGDGCNSTCQAEGAPFNCSIPGVACDRCGNSVRESSETCDDGSDVCNGAGSVAAGTACTSDAQCGGGRCVPAGGDGCNASCQTEPGWVCPIPGQPCGFCGNGTIEPNELCDDGDAVGSDGCNATCTQIEDHYACPTPGDDCVLCGDGQIDFPEACDDLNTAGGDGCSHNCLVVESGFTCPNNAGVGGTCTSCGNGLLEIGESCDDGNSSPGDGCASDCHSVESGYRCEVPGALCYLCGNGFKEGTEQCDDNNSNDGDGCSSTCVIDTANGWVCPVVGLPCGKCGNNIIEAIEICDDGNTNANDGCNATCTAIAPFYTCPPPNGSTPVACVRCGDGLQSGPEACDDGGKCAGGANAGTACTLHTQCASNVCAPVSGDGCNFNCTAQEPGFECVTPGAPCIECGDGLKGGSEECDDRNRQGGDGCSALCKLEAGPPYYNCDIVGSLCQRCGNGARESEEECDDGNAVSGDGCSDHCVVEEPYICAYAGQACERCGDGIAGNSEICDDGGQCGGAGTSCESDDDCVGEPCLPVDLDGCSVDCQSVEDWYECPITGGECDYTVVCGDGLIGGDETCDEGSNGPTVGCVNCLVAPDYFCPTPGQACRRVPFCGDGEQTGDEECDDGNRCSGGGPGAVTGTCLSNADCAGGTCGANPAPGCTNCELDTDYACPTAGENCVNIAVVCGDDKLGGTEACDDGTSSGPVVPFCDGGPDDGDLCDDDADCDDIVVNQTTFHTIAMVGSVQKGSFGTASTTVNPSLTLSGAAGTGRMFIAAVSGTSSNSRTVSAISFGGTAMNLIGSAVGSGGTTTPWTYVYYLRDSELPATAGSYTFSATLSATSTYGAVYQVMELTNVADQAPEASVALNFGGGSPSVSLVTQTNGAWTVDVVGTRGPDSVFTPTSGQTVRDHSYYNGAGTDSDHGVSFAMATRLVPTAGSITNAYTYTPTQNRSVQVTAAFKPRSTTQQVTTPVGCHSGFICYGGGFNGEQCEDDTDCVLAAAPIAQVGYNSYPFTSGPINQTNVPLTGTGVGRLLVVSIGGESDPAPTLSNVTFGGVAMIPINSAQGGTGTRSWSNLYYLGDASSPALPAAGNHTLAATVSGTQTAMAAHVLELQNVASATPESVATNSTSANATTISTQISTPSVGAWVIDAITNNHNNAVVTFTAAPSPAHVELGERAAGGATTGMNTALGRLIVGAQTQATLTWDMSIITSRTAHTAVSFAALGSQGTCSRALGADGCSNTCTVDPGWVCPVPGQKCVAELCGDGILAGTEDCEPSLTTPSVACNTDCTFNSDYACEIGNNDNCVLILTACNNNGIPELGEPCDDGDNFTADGCTPFCEIEPSCDDNPLTTGVVEGNQTLIGCTSKCGDGVILVSDVNEECDDGNLIDGDGCDDTCQVEAGWECAVDSGTTLSSTINVPVTFRDVIALPTGTGVRHPDFEIFAGNAATTGLVNSLLGTDHKPVRVAGRCDSTSTTGCPYGQQLTNTTNFNQWFNDTANVSVSIARQLPFTQQGVTNTYQYTNNALFPWDGVATSWVLSAPARETLSAGHDFGFTSEARYWFQYQGGEVLNFFGDDDLWVFINGHLAVDVGGLHPQTAGAVTLDAAQATAFQLVAGNIYEVSLFHAERHTNASNFQLTLGGFVKSKSTCTTICGEDPPTVNGAEQCDNGTQNQDGYGTCQENCQLGAFCGDGVKNGPEACDNGFNQSGYNSTGPGVCAPGCIVPPRCGDGIVQIANETCDGINNGTYGNCTPTCQAGPHCGDGTVDVGFEECDYGDGEPGCDTTCHRIPRCGDTFLDVGEECDDGNTSSGDDCSKTCDLETACGDGILDLGEDCDDSNTTSGDGCSASCDDEICGDGVTQSGEPGRVEQCDDGGKCLAGINIDQACSSNVQCPGSACTARSSDGCSATCQLETVCGNGLLEGVEQCDNGGRCSGGTAPPNTACTTLNPAPCTGGGTCLAVNNDGCSTTCQVETCGDGTKQTSEQCDDGNTVSGDGCSKTCFSETVCGNGTLETGEQCDPAPGNTTSGDGCSSTCRIEVCGDSVTQTGDPLRVEQCDDGNTTGGDGCSATCQREVICSNGTVEGAEQCDNGGTCSNSPTSCNASAQCPGGSCLPVSGDGCSATCQTEVICGDGVRSGSEQCDDGRKCGGVIGGAVCTSNVQCGAQQCLPVSGDGCSSVCQIEFCGDSVTQTGAPRFEECDTGNNVSGDGCSATCKLEFCGDDILQTGPPLLEQCDDGNQVSGDGCSASCATEAASCGNGVLEGIEECDEGAQNGVGQYTCRSDCTEVVCGDGITDPTEACDPNDPTFAGACSALCQLQAFCGNGALDPGEECDPPPGNNSSGDGCSSTCKLEVCGDGTRQPNESCDDGRRCGGVAGGAPCTSAATCGGPACLPASGDGCSATCAVETICGNGAVEGVEQCDNGGKCAGVVGGTNCLTTSSDADCGVGVACVPLAGDGCSSLCALEICGNGNPQDPLASLDPGETCDDGNTTSGDGCSNTCQIEAYCGNGVVNPGEQCDPPPGNNVSGDGCSSTCQLESVCGNGVVSGIEQCDDGNVANGDGCSSTCRTEAVCGNGILQGTEQCDDGCDEDQVAGCSPTDNGDGCSSLCQLETICGDGVKAPTEACDDGNTANGDGCRSNCTVEQCGDGIQDSGEQCDPFPGNNVSGDGCSSTCQLESVCGNGVVSGIEQCDDGNVANGDGCSSTCRTEAVCGNGI
ncbi:MAG TPA: DUF4215 domain-containing protein, partial [Polyangiaceae bacterium]|nr:DUF4215 domain-containing protein [Polyangiaceae bacterium]